MPVYTAPRASIYTANINPETGIAYGYISANALDSEIVNDLMYGDQAVDLSFHEGWLEWKRVKIAELSELPENAARSEEDIENEVDDMAQEFNDEWECSEPEIEGYYQGIRYKTSWLGGALNFFIFSSPFITEHARLASPCVPNAGILDTLDGDVQSYDVPLSWRHSDY